ncbi:DNA integrity scanning diadenylate cyclase DisA [Georgenia sp. 10Sc9-8]|uniref:DNA integrity scanning protein DisA n=1 Tax=Georgenia halotolerans TaxID=3028317 RepID=A0ABT5U0A2_9MICO|nr:DNA integrity scanning diadenylate cyclase DisA [Georgenia halotolerans]
MLELPHEGQLRATLQAVAPGTELRDGLERILRGRTGAIVVLGYDETVESICSGGFDLDVGFSATRLRELAKMDGAVVVDHVNRRIRRANVQLLPDAHIGTGESGMRHRTADRVARQTGYPVISVSQSMRIVALYVDQQRHVLEDSDVILSRANQALATLERYKARLDEVSGTLSALEIEDLVTVRDVTSVVQRMEMVSRISAEIDGYVTELGTDGRLLSLQLEELVGGIGPDRALLVRDYLAVASRGEDEALAALTRLTSAELIDMPTIARILGIGGVDGEALDSALSPRGYRLLARVPRLPATVIEAVVGHCGSLQAMLSASTEDLQQVEGVAPHRARLVREGLSRLAESSILERYV